MSKPQPQSKLKTVTHDSNGVITYLVICVIKIQIEKNMEILDVKYTLGDFKYRHIKLID